HPFFIKTIAASLSFQMCIGPLPATVKRRDASLCVYLFIGKRSRSDHPVQFFPGNDADFSQNESREFVRGGFLAGSQLLAIQMVSVLKMPDLVGQQKIQ